MRFIHHESAEISRYVELSGLHVMRCNRDGSSFATEEPMGAIEDMLLKTDTLWGLSLPYYLRVSASAETQVAPLDDAIARIENARPSDEFVIVAYQDGGIISVSSMQLPFQERAKRADWWRPSR